MASQTTGIQQLLAAEKKAAEQVNEARKRKTRRLKQAKEEAQQEIEKYRQQREQQFRQYEAKHLGSKDDIVQRIEQDLSMKISRLEQNVAVNKEKVINLLLKLVCDVQPQIHKNVRHQA